MPEYLDDPSVLTKDKLKSELLAHNVELPSGNPTKDVYVQLYLKNLTAQNNKHAPATTLDAFSSDEELPPPVVSSRSRSSGRKATRKTDKVQPDELDVTVLTDQDLKDELLKHGVDVGPIVASTRKLYEKKLQKLLDDGPVQPLSQVVLTEIQVNHNGNSEADLYSDKEDEVTAAPEPEPAAEPEPEPAPVVERPLRCRGKTPVTTRTRSSQHQTRDQLMDDEHDEESVLQVKHSSRRLSHRAIVPEDLRPVLINQVQLNPNRRTDRLDSPARADPPSTSSRHVQEPESTEALRAAAWSRPEERSPRPAARLPRVDPLTFSPICNISPIKRQESHWSLPDQFGPQPGCVSAAGVEKITASDETPKVKENNILKELFPNDINSPTGITATCRRPIRGAADRPVKSSDLWSNENSLFSPKTTKTSSSSSSYKESRIINRVTSLPPSTSLNSSTSTSSFSTFSSRPVSAAPPAGQTKAATRSMSVWIKLLLLATVAAFLFLVYQAMETNTINPFIASDTEVADGGTA